MPALSPPSGKKTNKFGKLSCFKYSSEDHWLWQCPQHTPERWEELKLLYNAKHGEVHAKVLGDIVGGKVSDGRIKAVLKARIME